MQRIVVVGCSGAGKSTLARALAERLSLHRIELDALYHGPGWVPRPEFAGDVERETRGGAWVVDGEYRAVAELLWSRADAVVWLDLPLVVAEWQAVKRSFFRWVGRVELWNGNREPSPLGWWDPGHPVRWVWMKHAHCRANYTACFDGPAWKHLARTRLRSRGEVRRFLASVPRS